MNQPTFADLDYESKKRKTRREKFLERMDGLIPWEELEECQGRREIRPCGGAKVYHLSGDVQRKCPPTTGVVGSP